MHPFSSLDFSLLFLPNERERKWKCSQGSRPRRRLKTWEIDLKKKTRCQKDLFRFTWGEKRDARDKKDSLSCSLSLSLSLFSFKRRIVLKMKHKNLYTWREGDSINFLIWLWFHSLCLTACYSLSNVLCTFLSSVHSFKKQLIKKEVVSGKDWRWWWRLRQDF